MNSLVFLIWILDLNLDFLLLLRFPLSFFFFEKANRGKIEKRDFNT